MADDVDRKFDPVKASELDDLHMLPGEMRAFRAEMRLAFELLTTKIIPIIDRQGADIADLRERVASTEQRLNALEVRPRPRAKR